MALAGWRAEGAAQVPVARRAATEMAFQVRTFRTRTYGLMFPGGLCSLSRFRLSGLARFPSPGSRAPGDLAGSGLFEVVVYLCSAKTRPCRPVRRGRVRGLPGLRLRQPSPHERGRAAPAAPAPARPPLTDRALHLVLSPKNPGIPARGPITLTNQLLHLRKYQR